MPSSPSGGKKRPSIRDHMDPIMEAGGLYRKHVAHESDSLFRSVSDSLFDTQFYRDVVRTAFKYAQDLQRKYSDSKYSRALVLAERFNFKLEILNTSDRQMIPFVFEPQRRSFDKEILLCYTSPGQYDPVYKKSSIEAASVVQSILYEMLYVHVFNVDDAMEAAELMLHGAPDPERGKPDVYDKEFKGTAMEALQQFLIPFPYKVAKALDTDSYRNIEYDVWTCEQRSCSTSEATPKSPNKSKPRTIGTLAPGTACRLHYVLGNEACGFIQGPTSSGRKIEVFLPLYDQCVYVERSMVLPLKHVPKEMQFLPRFPQERPRLVDQAQWIFERQQNTGPKRSNSIGIPPLQFPENSEEEEDHHHEDLASQNRNLFMVTARDPNWLNKFDFSVPPPLPQQQQSDDMVSNTDSDPSQNATVLQNMGEPTIDCYYQCPPLTPVISPLCCCEGFLLYHLLSPMAATPASPVSGQVFTFPSPTTPLFSPDGSVFNFGFQSPNSHHFMHQ